VDDRSAGRSEKQPEPRSGERSATMVGDVDDLIAYSVPWTGNGRWLVAGPAGALQKLVDRLRTAGAQQLPESVFHQQRVLHRFPWFGTDLDDRNLPQEADRDAMAISFTKGCYLGQETVARLDALGQVQKKLVLWRITSSEPPAVNTELSHDGRVVGRLTSVVADPAGDGYLALGFARRSHFEAGAEAQSEGGNGEVVRATVI
jgi:folate-binding protein YgfZ